MAIFSDIELVSICAGRSPDAFEVVFDVIYAGETWCRSVVRVDGALQVARAGEPGAIVGAARDALLESLLLEAGPVSLELRLSDEGTAVVDRGSPGGGGISKDR